MDFNRRPPRSATASSDDAPRRPLVDLATALGDAVTRFTPLSGEGAGPLADMFTATVYLDRDPFNVVAERVSAALRDEAASKAGRPANVPAAAGDPWAAPLSGLVSTAAPSRPDWFARVPLAQVSGLAPELANRESYETLDALAESYFGQEGLNDKRTEVRVACDTPDDFERNLAALDPLGDSHRTLTYQSWSNRWFLDADPHPARLIGAVYWQAAKMKRPVVVQRRRQLQHFSRPAAVTLAALGDLMLVAKATHAAVADAVAAVLGVAREGALPLGGVNYGSAWRKDEWSILALPHDQWWTAPVRAVLMMAGDGALAYDFTGAVNRGLAAEAANLAAERHLSPAHEG